MKRFVILCVILFTAVIAVSEQDAEVQFARYIKKYNRRYEPHEISQRFENFKSSLERIENRNKKSKNAKFGINKFSDMSVAEFKSKVLMHNPVKTVYDRDASKVLRTIPHATPKYLDWRTKGAVTPVKDQEQCGSCWAFSATEEIESVWILAGKATNETVNLSPQQIVDCDYASAGCDGGQPITAYDYVRLTGGIEPASDYPYTGEGGSCDSNSADYVAHISNWAWASGVENENDLLSNLVTYGPISVCVYAETWMDYESGVMSESDCENSIFDMDHCVQLVGFDTVGHIYNYQQKYWIVRNSWNTDWGMDGYILLEMGQDTCGIADSATYPIV